MCCNCRESSTKGSVETAFLQFPKCTMQPSNWRYLNGNLKCLGFALKSIFWLRLKNCRTCSICLRICNLEVESKFLANASSDGIDPWQNSKFTVTPEARGLGSDTGWNCNWCSVDMSACEALMHYEHFDWCTVNIDNHVSSSIFMGALHCALCSRKLLLVICASSSSARNGTYYLEIVLNCANQPRSLPPPHPAVKIVNL